MIKVPTTTTYLDKFRGFNKRYLEYINNSRNFTFNVLEGAVRSSKTVCNIYAAALAIEESPDRLHVAMGYSAKTAVKTIFESDGLGLMYFPPWQGRLFTKSVGPGIYSLVLMPAKDSTHPVKEILPLGGGESDAESSFRGMSVGIVILTEANLLHPISINSIVERTYAASIRRFFIDFNPTAAGNFLYKFIGNKWLGIEELPLKPGTERPIGYSKVLPDGRKHNILQYLHATFKDNLSLGEDRIQEIVAMSDPESPEYKRNVLGLRASGVGKIYRLTKENFLHGQIERARYFRYVVVADPGQNKSETAFLVAAITNDKIPELHILHEYTHINSDLAPEQAKSELDYVYDFFAFIKEAEQITQMQPWKILVDPAATSFIREYNRNAKVNGIYSTLASAVKNKIDERIKMGITLQYSQRMRFHSHGGQRTAQEFEAAEYDERKSLKGLYERLDNPASSTQLGLVDCAEYAIEAFAYHLFKYSGGDTYTPDHRQTRQGWSINSNKI